MDFLATLAEQHIREAMARGEFDNLPQKGQPIPREDDSDVPEELRIGFKILRNAGYLPEELQLNREILTLRELVAACRDPEKEGQLRRRLSEKMLRYELLMERNGRNPHYCRYAGRIRDKLGL